MWIRVSLTVFHRFSTDSCDISNSGTISLVLKLLVPSHHLFRQVLQSSGHIEFLMPTLSSPPPKKKTIKSVTEMSFHGLMVNLVPNDETGRDAIVPLRNHRLIFITRHKTTWKCAHNVPKFMILGTVRFLYAFQVSRESPVMGFEVPKRLDGFGQRFGCV